MKCFYCGGTLSHWEIGDDPWVEHAKNFSDCCFVTLNKSRVFIEECKRLAEQNQQSIPSPNQSTNVELNSAVGSDSEDQNNVLNASSINEWMNSDIVIQLIDLNAFPIDVIKSVLNKRWLDEREPFPSLAQLYDAVNQWRSDSSLQM